MNIEHHPLAHQTFLVIFIGEEIRMWEYNHLCEVAEGDDCTAGT